MTSPVRVKQHSRIGGGDNVIARTHIERQLNIIFW